MSKILLADDDAELLAMFTDYLEGEGLQVETASDGLVAVAKVLVSTYDAVVLDVMMPGMSGLDALREIRTRSNVPVLMLTAKGDDMDRILGLELGADDYIPKPCMPRELVARLRAVLRRTGNAAPDAHNTSHGQNTDKDTDQDSDKDSDKIQISRLSVFPGKRQAQWDGKTINLTSTEYNLLELLALHAGSPVSKQVLCEQGLGRPLSRFDRSVDVHMSSIRQKLGLLNDGRSCIQTIIRHGYQLIRD